MAPAIMAPKGTPACLIEKTSAIRSAVEVLAKICELAGVMGP